MRGALITPQIDAALVGAWVGLVTALAVACATGGPPSRAWDSTGDAGGWPRRVAGVETCLDAFSDARCARWYRPGVDPIVGRMDFLVADDGAGCPVAPELAVMAVLGNNFTCRWRLAR